MLKNFKDNIKTSIKENANWLTAILVAAIFIVGITIVSNPSAWWIALLAVLVLGVIAYTLVNGRVVIKAILSIVILAIIVTISSVIAPSLSLEPFFNVVWPLYILSAYFLSLALSYLLYSGVGRWGYLSFTTILNLIITVALIALGASSQLSAVIAAIASVGLFVLFYKVNRKTIEKRNMPNNGFSKDLYKAIIAGAEDLNMKVRLVDGNKKIGPHFLIYGKRSYILYPIIMEQAFGVTGKFKQQLSYMGNSVNQWLAKLAFVSSVSWKAKGATPPLILVDLTRKNGVSRLIGLSIPDSKNKGIVGIIPAPAKSMERNAYGVDLITLAIETMKDYSSDLTKKQRENIAQIGYSIEDFELDKETTEES